MQTLSNSCLLLVPGSASSPWGAMGGCEVPSAALTQSDSWDRLVSKPAHGQLCCSCSPLGLGVPSLSSAVSTEGRLCISASLFGNLQRRTFRGIRPTDCQKQGSSSIERTVPNHEAMSSPLAEGWVVTLQVGTFLGVLQVT